MNPLKLRFLTERYEKELLGLKLQEEFIALPGQTPVSGKFYAKHDAPLPNHVAPAEYIKIVQRSTSVTPKENYDFPPPCVNMEYGWFIEPLIPRSRDPRLHFPLSQCDFIKTEIYIREMQKKMPKPKKEEQK
ncbi:hypothetical protein QAD02_008505 [Eretmocerus hayati]|uniref:Uncharacterized protein n=1 Tax=Eretmocerus hayati TaxID=131215 RepID=A0ACC2N7Y7_9HYME|nr:hypothetical protein QAD02_008505 [Eretmocerus hayati]